MRKTIGLVLLLSFFAYRAFSAGTHDHEAREVKSNEHEKHEKHIEAQHNEKIEKETDDHAHEKNEKPDAHEKHEKNEKDEEHDEHEESGKKVGVGYGVEEQSETLGFKLSAKALQHFNIKISPVGDVSKFIVPKSSIVQFKDEIGLFIVTNKYIRRITGTIETKTAGQILFKSNQIKSSDQYVTEGADFLRIVEISLEGEGIQGHSH